MWFVLEESDRRRIFAVIPASLPPPSAAANHLHVVAHVKLGQLSRRLWYQLPVMRFVAVLQEPTAPKLPSFFGPFSDTCMTQHHTPSHSTSLIHFKYHFQLCYIPFTF
jgi:hypothetical protein